MGIEGAVLELSRRLLLLLAVALGGMATAVIASVPSHGHARALKGTISFSSFHSSALRGTDHYSIYLPPGYSHSKRRYPVIYFLHGLPEQAGAYKSIGAVAQAVELSGHQAIVVGAQGARSGDPDPEWLDHGPGRNWETATAVELVKTIDTATARSLRARGAY